MTIQLSGRQQKQNALLPRRKYRAVDRNASRYRGSGLILAALLFTASLLFYGSIITDILPTVAT
jgi:hypothetical protein